MSRFLLQPPAGVWKESTTSAMWVASALAYQVASLSRGTLRALRPSAGTGEGRRPGGLPFGAQGLLVGLHLALGASQILLPCGLLAGEGVSQCARSVSGCEGGFVPTTEADAGTKTTNSSAIARGNDNEMRILIPLFLCRNGRLELDHAFYLCGWLAWRGVAIPWSRPWSGCAAGRRPRRG